MNWNGCQGLHIGLRDEVHVLRHTIARPDSRQVWFRDVLNDGHAAETGPTHFLDVPYQSWKFWGGSTHGQDCRDALPRSSMRFANARYHRYSLDHAPVPP